MQLGEFLKQRRRAALPEARRLGAYERLSSRVGKPLTQEEVAEALGVSRTWYAMLEAGSGRISVALASRVADAFALDATARAELIRIALPDGATLLPSEDGLTNLDVWPVTQPGVTIAIASTTEIEETVRRLATLREHFLNSPDVVVATRSRVFNSWLRSRAAAVEPGQQSAPITVSRDFALDELRARNERLLRAARPIVAFLRDRLADAGYVVVLADGHGRILEVTGSSALRHRIERHQFVPGGDWSETASGTNAIGTALVDRRPLQLLGAEHFCDGWQDITCTAAPIRDVQTMEVVGVLDITATYQLVRPHLLGMIMQAALEIEERLAAPDLATAGP